MESLRAADVVPIGVGCYTAFEAARLIRTEPRNIRRWLGGDAHKRRDGENTRAAPLWRLQLPRLGDSLELGFRDLVELRFVVAFLKHGVRMSVVRRCLERAREIVGDERPLSTERFRTDGKTLFLESLSASEGAADASPVMDLQDGQMVFRRVIEPTFRDLDFLDGSAAQWRPYKGKPSLVIDPTRSFGQPLAADYGVPTATLASAANAEGSAQRAARLYEVPLAVVNDAIAFERSLLAA